MRRLRVPAIFLAAFALWLAPRFLEPAAPGRPLAPVAPPVGSATPIKYPPRAASASATPPADTIFTLSEGGAPRPYAVALDEIYLPDRPASRRIASIPPQASLSALLTHAASLAGTTSAETSPRLVLYPVGSPRDARTRRIVNPRIEVTLASADAPSPALRPDLGIVAWDRPSYARGIAIARIAGDAAQPLRAAVAAASLPGVRVARPLLARQQFARFVPNDPLFKSQWHLRNTGQQGGKAGVDVRAVPAWDTTTGSGVIIGIVDNGVDLSHPDLVPALDNTLGYDWNGNDTNPSAEDHDVDYGDGEIYLEHDDHGTAVAGLAAARGNNGVGGDGVAPSATLAALRLIAAPTDSSEEGAAMSWHNEIISIKNNSWGPYDYYPDLSPAPDIWLAAVADGVANGRGGRGVLYFWSAGNGQSSGDQGTLDGYASARSVIAVAATTNTGAPANFSEGGPHIVVAAPGDASGGLVTTDRLGSAGYSSGDYTQTFAGTSASAPVASGAGALLLAARPDLGWRDVKEILLRSSTKLQPTSLDWVSRPAGDPAHPIKHHPRFGGGNVNALDALALARTWIPLGTETYLTAFPADYGPWPIPDNSNSVLTVTFDIPDGSPVLRVEHAVLTVDITHPYRGDLEISLTSPSGTVSRFAQTTSLMAGGDPAYPTVGADYPNYPFTSVRHWGEAAYFPGSSSRKWTLKIRDGQRLDAGTLNSATLTLYGTELVAPAIVTPLKNQALATGSTLVLTAGFSGGNLSYEWRRDGQLIAGADTAEYRLANFSAKFAGTYTCTATNSVSSAGTVATVTVDDSPRATLPLRASQTTTIDLGDYIDTDVKLWKSTALPAGLRLDPATGLITGRPTKPGTTSLLVTATSADGVVTRIPLILAIEPIPATMTRAYLGLVARDATLNAKLGGTFTITANTSGTTTGQLTLGAARYSFTGRLDGAPGQPATLAVRVPRGSLPAVDLALTISADGQTAVGSLRPVGSDTGAALSGRRRIAPPSAQEVAYPFSTVLRFLLRETTPATELPEGYSPGFFTIAADGKVTWKLHPSDGATASTGSTYLTDSNTFFLHAPVPAGQGSIQGSITLGQDDNGAAIAETNVDWFRAAVAALAKPAGFGPKAMDLTLDLRTPLALVGAKPVFLATGPVYLSLLDVPRADLALDNPALGLYPQNLLSIQFNVPSANTLAAATSVLKPAATLDTASTLITGKLTLTYLKPGSASATVTSVVPFVSVLIESNPPQGYGFIVLPRPPGSTQAPLSVPIRLP